MKEIEDGIPGTPAEEVFKELLGEDYRRNNAYKNSKSRLVSYPIPPLTILFIVRNNILLPLQLIYLFGSLMFFQPETSHRPSPLFPTAITLPSAFRPTV